MPKKKIRAKRGIKREVTVEARTEGQEEYINLINSKDVIICNGIAGTGKTIVAVGMSLKLLRESPAKYNRIVMIRPAVTVRDEEIGHLPGDIDEKMRPFIMPMLDSLQLFLIRSEIDELFATGIIEICPISYMRGRTFNNCIMLFDEAQNCTIEQMKMVSTRIGFNTKLIIEGDVTQSDILKNNGLADAMKRFGNVDGIGVVNLESKDVVRSPIVARILKTYDAKEEKLS